MAIFNSYVKLPEGICYNQVPCHSIFPGRDGPPLWPRTTGTAHGPGDTQSTTHAEVRDSTGGLVKGNTSSNYHPGGTLFDIFFGGLR